MNQSTCTICSDFLTVNNATACPCGHTFHYECIMTWKEHSATCPQCRIRFKTPIKLFFDLNNSEDKEMDGAALRNQLSDAKLKLQTRDLEKEKLLKENEICWKQLSVLQSEDEKLRKRLQNTKGHNSALKNQLNQFEEYKLEAKRARQEVASMEQKLLSFKNISELVKGERHDVESMLKSYADSSESLNQIATSFAILKKEFDKLKETKKKLEHEKRIYKKSADMSTQQCEATSEKISSLTADVLNLNEMNKNLEQKVRKLENCICSSSPRSQAMKRALQEGQSPIDNKRSRLHDDHDASWLLPSDRRCHGDSFESDIADEFGIKRVSTTNIAAQRVPLRELNRPTKNVSSYKAKTSSSSTRQGFNGMGGQSKVLILPRKSGTLAPPQPKKESRKLKLTRTTTSNLKMSRFLTEKLPTIKFSP